MSQKTRDGPKKCRGRPRKPLYPVFDLDGQIDFPEWMYSVKLDKLSKKDMAFIQHCCTSHIELLRKKRSALYTRNLKQEEETTERVLHTLRMAKFRKKGFSEDDFWFLEFCLTDTADFVAEGLAEPFSSKGKDLLVDARRATVVISRLAEIAGIPKSELVYDEPDLEGE